MAGFTSFKLFIIFSRFMQVSDSKILNQICILKVYDRIKKIVFNKVWVNFFSLKNK